MDVTDEGDGKVAVNRLVGLDIDGPHDLVMAPPGTDGQEQPRKSKGEGAVIDGNRPLPQVIAAHELGSDPQQEPRNEEHRRVVRKGEPIAGKTGQSPRHQRRQNGRKDVGMTYRTGSAIKIANSGISGMGRLWRKSDH